MNFFDKIYFLIFSEVIHLVGGKPENERNGEVSFFFFLFKLDLHRFTLRCRDLYMYFLFLEHYEYTISDWKRDNDTNSSVKYHMTNSSIRIPSDGFYFLYCRLSFSSDNGESKRSSRTTIKHSIRIKPINQRFQKFVTVTTPMTDMIDSSGNSYIQRVAKFRKGEELKVTVSRAGKLQYDASDVTGNYFGMFKL